MCCSQRLETQSNRRVLIVDDEIDSQNPLTKLLALEGFTIECVQTGADALAWVHAASYDAILLDLHLRDMLGLTILSTWRRAAVAVPIVAVTGWYLDDGHERASAALGAAAFLRKPLDASVLVRTLRRVIAAQPGEPPPVPSAIDHSPSPAGLHRIPGVHTRTGHEEKLRVLHERAVHGDDAAADQIVNDLLPVLRRQLRARFATAEDEWIHDATVDTLMDYRAHRTRYDPARGVPLAAYLLYAARRDLLNRLDAERRRTAREQTTADGVLPEPRAPVRTYTSWSGGSPTIALRDAALTEAERTVLRLWRRGERSTKVYADALHLDMLPATEQQLRIKRMKDRITLRIRRFAKRYVGNASQ